MKNVKRPRKQIVTRKRKTQRNKVRKNAIIVKHISGIKRALLDGDKRVAFLEYFKLSNQRNGLYALYDKKGNLYYVGKATDLKARLNAHLKDRHSESWDQMTLFFLSKSANVSELEGLLVAAAKPPGNTQKPKIGKDLRNDLKKFLTNDAKNQIDEVIYPDREIKKNSLSGNLTAQKLKSLTKVNLAKAMKVTRRELRYLISEEPVYYKAVRRYIRQSGRRDAVLLLFEKQKS